MTLSGLNTGRINLEVGNVNASDVLARLTSLVAELQRGKEVIVEWDCPERCRRCGPTLSDWSRCCRI